MLPVGQWIIKSLCATPAIRLKCYLNLASHTNQFLESRVVVWPHRTNEYSALWLMFEHWKTGFVFQVMLLNWEGMKIGLLVAVFLTTGKTSYRERMRPTQRGKKQSSEKALIVIWAPEFRCTWNHIWIQASWLQEDVNFSFSSRLFGWFSTPCD